MSSDQAPRKAEDAKRCPLCGTHMIKRPRLRPGDPAVTGEEWACETCKVIERAD